METSIEQHPECAHCGSPCYTHITLQEDKGTLDFCCHGCREVYRILNENDLCDYYALAENPGNSLKKVDLKNSSFQYLDETEFLDKYAPVNKQGERTLRFYIEGIHCVACLWLIERLPQLVPNVVESKLNMAESIARVTISAEGSFGAAASRLHSIGYHPHPILESEDAHKQQMLEERRDLTRIGVAFASMGNIMLLAFSVYMGLEGVLERYFTRLSFVISLPVMLYSATSFYKNAFYSLKRKEVSLDVPIVIAILFSFIASTINMLRGSSEVYFDSIATLVFLLLFARFVNKKAQLKGMKASEVSSLLATGVARRVLGNGATQEVHSGLLRAGDKILVKSGELFGADGVVESGSGFVNNSLLTGESHPVQVGPKSKVYAGCVNQSEELMVLVEKVGSESRLGKIIERLESQWGAKAKIIQLTDRVGKYFVATVLILAVLTFVITFYFLGFEEAFQRALGLVIVTCPCALGLATPLAMTLALKGLAKNGILVKSELVLEKVASSKEITFDKTGTLTKGEYRVVNHSDMNRLKELDWNVLYLLESRSYHPVALAIISWLDQKIPTLKDQCLGMQVQNFKEQLGIGVSGEFDGDLYECIANKETSDFQVVLKKNGEILLGLSFGDELRSDTLETINQLGSMGHSLYLVSGDHASAVSEVAKKLAISNGQVLAEASPIDKADFLTQHPQSLFVGDGANDALALSRANVGVAMKGSVEVSLKAADVYIGKDSLKAVIDLVNVSIQSKKTIYINLVFSLLYNITGAVLAMMGFINPLWAAILMPISSLTVLSSTLLSSRGMLKKIK